MLSQHYCDVIMGAIASQITSLAVVYSTDYSDADQRQHQSSASMAFVWGIHRGPVNSPHEWPVTRINVYIWWRHHGWQIFGLIRCPHIPSNPSNVTCVSWHYNDVIMTTMASLITSLTVVYSNVYSDADQRNHQSSASLAFVWQIHRDLWIPRTNGQ